MEIVAVEGPLTDFEVYEILNSSIYNKYDNFTESEKKIRNYSRSMDDIKRKMRSLTEKPMTPQEETAYKLNSKALDRKQRELMLLKKSEDVLWMKHYLLKYFEILHGSTQTQNDIESFCSELEKFQKEHNMEFMPNEILMIINNRPTDEVQMSLLVDSLYKRIPSPEIREQFINLVSDYLPEGPVLEELEMNDEEEGDEGEDELNLDNDDDIIRDMADTDEQAAALDDDNTLSIEPKYQTDKDDDHSGEKEEGSTTIRSRFGRK